MRAFGRILIRLPVLSCCYYSSAFLLASKKKVISLPTRGLHIATGCCVSLFANAVNGEGGGGDYRQSRSSSSSRGSGGANGEEPARTGWNHNQPDENSKFWEPSIEEKSENLSSSSSKKLRTGWLHNTQSQRELEKKRASNTIANNNDNTTSPARRLLERAMKQKERNHRIVAPPTFHACGEDTVMAVTEHMLSVPLVRNNNNDSDDKNKNIKGESTRIDVFFKIAEKVKSEEHRAWLTSLSQDHDNGKALTPQQRAALYVENAAMKNADQMILYLQGGPGFGAPTPVVSLGFGKGSSWAAAAWSAGYDRVVLMDQRGTGKSTTLTKQALERKFPDLFLLDGPEVSATATPSTPPRLQDFDHQQPEVVAKVQQAVHETVHYMTQFRADSIVRDAEDIREALLLTVEEEEEEKKEQETNKKKETAKPEQTKIRPWGACLGQSFGGFCIMTYLSLIENPPKICLLTGGIGPAFVSAHEVYTRLWQRVRERSLLYYDMYPGDVALVRKIVYRLIRQPEPLPSGGMLTARRFLQLGIALGGPPSSFASLHALFHSAFLQGTEDDEIPQFNRAFLKNIELDQSYDDYPIYFWLHESIYADGPTYSPTSWAAHQAYQEIVAKDPDFDYHLTSAPESEKPVLLFGEMTFPWMTEDFGELQGVGLTEVAQTLANKKDWPSLYDADHMRKILHMGTTRAAAAVYFDDMYVDFDCCHKLTSRGGPLDKVKVWITNDYQHSGLRDDGAKIFTKLYGMAIGAIRTPS